MYYVACIIVAASIMQFLLLPIYIRMKRSEKHLPIRVLLKGMMTLIAVLFCGAAISHIYKTTGSIFCLYTETGFHTNIAVLIGLIICMIGDMLLPVSFVAGMLTFLCGHICYIAYFLTIAPFNPLCMVLLAFLVFSASVFFHRYKESRGKLRAAYYIYGVVILTTFSTAVFLPFTLGAYGVVPAVAAVLLVISDFMLAINNLNRRKVLSDLMYLSYYFMGQFFLALSVFLPVYLGI